MFRFAKVRRETSSVALVAVLSFATNGCLFYDSRWGQTKQAQRNSAAQVAPAALQASDAPPNPEAKDAPPAKPRTMRVRILVTRGFTQHVADTPRYARELFDDANKIIEPTAGLHLEIESIRTWNLASEDDTAASLHALQSAEPGNGVDEVVGFVGALSRTSLSFHDLGMGVVVGKHLVVRAPGSAELHDAVERNYDELGDEERRRLRKELVRHRANAVFLHELGHNLGSVHEAYRTSIMAREYDRKMTGFGGASAQLMRMTSKMRAEGASDATIAGEVTAFVRRAPDGVFAPDEATLAALDAVAARARNTQSGEAANAGTTPTAPSAPETPELTGPDRERFVKAHQAAGAGDVVLAWDTGKPLFASYTDSMAVQDLRCRIAMGSMPFDVARRECARLMELSTGNGSAPTKSNVAGKAARH